MQDGSEMPLAELPDRTRAVVVALDMAFQGYARQRLLDLGLTEGTIVEPVLRTFAGDPRAYRIRGTTIALRRDQASHVLVRPLTTNERGSMS
jgi:Fe2+ transport system protein FeoA